MAEEAFELRLSDSEFRYGLPSPTLSCWVNQEDQQGGKQGEVGNIISSKGKFRPKWIGIWDEAWS